MSNKLRIIENVSTELLHAVASANIYEQMIMFRNCSRHTLRDKNILPSGILFE